jgi:hypothetical protein
VSDGYSEAKTSHGAAAMVLQSDDRFVVVMWASNHWERLSKDTAVQAVNNNSKKGSATLANETLQNLQLSRRQRMHGLGRNSLTSNRYFPGA